MEVAGLERQSCWIPVFRRPHCRDQLMNLNWKELLAVEYCSTWGAIAWEAWPHADTHSLSTGAGLIALRGPDGTIAIHRRWFSGGILRTWPQSLRSDIGILIEEAGAVPQDSAIAECRVRVERRRGNSDPATSIRGRGNPLDCHPDGRARRRVRACPRHSRQRCSRSGCAWCATG